VAEIQVLKLSLASLVLSFEQVRLTENPAETQLLEHSARDQEDEDPISQA
jgi:hypothetical protein